MSSNKLLYIKALRGTEGKSPKNLHQYEVKAKAGWNITLRKVSIYISRAAQNEHASQHENISSVKTPWSYWGQQAANRRKDGLGTRRVTTVCVFAFGVCREGLPFFHNAICATARKACIVCTCKPPVNDHCVEALMTIPFELPTLLFFHGLKLCSVRQGKQECNGHFLAGQLCETRLPLCVVCDGLRWSKTPACPRKVQKFRETDGKLKWASWNWYSHTLKSFQTRFFLVLHNNKDPCNSLIFHAVQRILQRLNSTFTSGVIEFFLNDSRK